MSEAVKDIALDGNEGLQAEIAKALKPYKDQLAAKETEVAQIRRVAAERDATARDLQSKLQQTVSYTTRTEHSAISNALAEADARSSGLERDLALAIETADGKAAAKIQKEISALEARKLLLEQGKSRIEEDIEADRRRAEQVARNPPPTPQPQVDDFESLVAKLPPNQQGWVRQHKDKYYTPGQGLSQKVIGAYHLARGNGLAEDSPQLVAFMDRVLGHTQQQQQAQPEQGNAADRFVEVKPDAPKQPPAKPQQQQRQAMPSAPVARGAGGGNVGAQRGGTVGRLSQAEVHTAERMGMSPQEYLHYKGVAIARGKPLHMS